MFRHGQRSQVMLLVKVANWHGLKFVKVKDMYPDMARQHYRQESQAPTHRLKVTDLMKDQQLKFM